MSSTDRALRALVRLLLRVFFQRVEVVGEELIPLDRPLVLVGNHVNGLVDALLILGPLPVWPRLLGKNTLWKIPVLRPLLQMAGVIPVYRAQDQVDTAQNEESFARCHDVLIHGSLSPGDRGERGVAIPPY